LAENEFLRQKREREFQQKVLAALDKPAANKLWTIVNSRLFSVIVLGVLGAAIGAYFTQSQQCLRDSDQLSERWYRLTREVYTRHEALFHVVRSAKSVSEVRAQLNQLQSVYADLRDRSLFDLTRERRLINDRIDFAATTDMIWKSKERPEVYFSAGALMRYGSILLGVLERDIADQEIDKLREYVAKRFQTVFFEFSVERNIKLSPRCSFITVTQSLFGGRPRIIVANMFGR
jgi:hypothetical protein